MAGLIKIDGRKCFGPAGDWTANQSDIECFGGLPLFLEAADLPGDTPGAVRVFVKQCSRADRVVYGQAGSNHKLTVLVGE